MKKTIKSAILVILSLIVVFSLAACDLAAQNETPEITTESIINNEEGSSGSEANENTVSQTGIWKDAMYLKDAEFGNGSKTVVVQIKAEGQMVTFTIKTDKDTVGAALMEHGLIDGDQGAYGLYVKKVNGMIADYDVNQTYWAFYVNGGYGMTGVDMTEINESDTYQLELTKG